MVLLIPVVFRSKPSKYVLGPAIKGISYVLLEHQIDPTS
uniref:Uncharacterized protein n=1 Tax=Rhizophora mucronata TaxID=61149 RepID=A0A2P2ILQ7_RHIMU